jgi:hypothetical protein
MSGPGSASTRAAVFGEHACPFNTLSMESAMKPLTLNLPKPRNPLAHAARLRAAGRHRGLHRACRQAARRELRNELKHWHAPPQ